MQAIAPTRAAGQSGTRGALTDEMAVGQEIERKFLVKHADMLEGLSGDVIKQGYLARGEATVRVRRRADKAYLTIKGRPEGIARAEYEYEIPVEDAEQMLATLCDGDIIAKKRYELMHEGLCWEVDVFEGANAGLVVAEVELESSDQEVALPDWAGEDVSDDGRYSNSALSKQPYSRW